MIVRVFRASLRPGAEPQFLAASRHNQAVEWDGLVSRLVAVQMEGERCNTVSISVWRDAEALRAFAGDEPEHPVLAPEDFALLASWTIEHFEVILREEFPLPVDPDAPGAPPI